MKIPRIIALFATLFSGCLAWADIVQCENGDTFNGRVLAVSETEVKLQSEVAGTITIPRDRVSVITFKKTAVAKGAAVGSPQLKPGQVLAIDPAAVAQVQNQFLADATPEARQKFQEMVSGLMTGTLKVEDIQAQARNALADLKALQKELGEGEESELLGTYASLLEAFVKQAPPANPAAPNPPAKPPVTVPAQPGAE